MNAPYRPLDRLLRLRDVEDAVGLKKTQIYARIAEGKFPRPHKLRGTRTSRWRTSEIAAWIEDQPSG